MKYFDRNSNATRIPSDVRPLVEGFLSNTQIFDQDQQDPPYITNSVKYQRREKDRRKTSEYEGDDPFVQEIIDIFNFSPLDFQVESWQQIRRLDERRREANNSQAAIFSAPTGFGKTEAFLGALYHLLGANEQDLAIVVYPRRALLQDQLGRILKHIHELNVKQDISLSVGVWTGEIPYTAEEVEARESLFATSSSERRFKFADCWCGEGNPNSFLYRGGVSTYRLVCEENESHVFTDRELILNRSDIINGPGPDILLTTLESLELFSLKPNYDIIQRASTIVFDEVHLYTGLRGAHTANIAQNIETITEQPLLWLGSSATVDDPKRFATDLFPVPSGRVHAIEPPDSDYATDHGDGEHYYFLKTADEGPGSSSMAIQQIMLLGHALLERDDNERGKLLSFIDSTSQVNQMRVQLEDADRENRLWQFHREGDSFENWNQVAQEMGYRFIDSPLAFQSIYSDAGFDAGATADSDVLLSTSFLEVGIDVGDIRIVTQYRTPWDLSSFIQRAGRAGRKENTDSHVVVFLSNLTQDANMFYRADRFLGSEIRTPLNTNNHVVSTLHDQFASYYEIASSISNQWFSSSIDRKEAFLEEFLGEELGYQQYCEFILDPSNVLTSEFGIGVDEQQLPPLHGEGPVETAEQILARLREEIKNPDLDELIDIDDEQHLADNYDQILIDKIRVEVLGFCDERKKLVKSLESSDIEGEHRRSIDFVESSLHDIRTELNKMESLDPSEQLRRLDEQVPKFYEITSHIERIRRAANRSDQPISVPSLAIDIHNIIDLIDSANQAFTDEDLEETATKLNQIHYLGQALDQLREYNSHEYNDKSLHYVKYLLRGAYYYDRFLRQDGRALADDVWYVPPNYFQESGKYFTVFYGQDTTSGAEQSIEKLVQSYAPYRSEYQQEAGHLQAFLPKTILAEGEVQFSFEGIPGEKREGILTPDSIQLTDVDDLSGGRALNIVRYCPECFQILNEDRCLRHNDRAYGKIHSSPKVVTSLEDHASESNLGIATLADVNGKVTLSGVSLEITPARPVGENYEFIFTGEDRIEQEINSGEVPLGFELDTRGLIFDVSDFVSTLGQSTVESVSRYKDLDELSVDEIAFHTAAHCFTHLVADIGGVNPSMLFYGVDEEAERVYVFERSQGGQGIVDLVFDDFRSDPGTVLNSLIHITYNPQVINERLWANKDFVNKLSPKPSEDEIRSVLVEMDEVPMFPAIIDLIVDEVMSSIDRAAQLSKEEGITVETAFGIKHTVASERVRGNEDFPARAVSEEIGSEEALDRIESLFFSPDIDGCVENLHLAECFSGHSQSDSLSYSILERLREHLIERVPTEEVDAEIIDRELLPGGEINGTSVFFTL